MIKKYNNLSFVFGVPGVLLYYGSFAMLPGQPDVGPPVGGLMLLIGGMILLFVGLGYYARSRGRSSAWGLAGALGIIGLIALACLKDKHKLGLETEEREQAKSDLAAVKSELAELRNREQV